MSERNDKGQFKKGQSGNPNGRPAGSKNKRTLLALETFEGESETLCRKAIELALDGDTSALRLCLERIAPPVKECPIHHFDLPEITSAEDVGVALASLASALSSGELLPSEALSISNLLEKYQKHYEMNELERRIEKLEATQ